MAAKTVIVTLRNKKGLVVYQGVFSGEDLKNMDDLRDRFVEIVKNQRKAYRGLTIEEITDLFDITDFNACSYFK